MFRRFLTPVLVLLLLTVLAAQTQQPAAPRQADSADLQSLKADSQRMRALLNQMRTNLAFVDTTQSPLKHQFELEADMWQVMLDQMDRRIEKMDNAGRQ
ncbi:MAG TPA: hypothetical protein VGF06_11375 [Terriglobales bacterium]|jgi:hypothetical protein